MPADVPASKSAPPPSLSPNHTLAATIADALTDAKLIPAAKRNEVNSKLAQGTATMGDWRLWAELSAAEEQAAEGGRPNG